MKLFILLLLVNFSAQATEIVFVNHTGADAKLAALFNVCQGYLINSDKPVMLKDGDSFSLKTITVMHHYKICAVGYCSETAIQMKDDRTFQIEMVLDGSVIDGKITPNQWGGPTNACPSF